MLVREFIDTIDASLVVELYMLEEKLKHEGTFNLDNDVSRNELLENYGDEVVKNNDLYKAYALIYI